MDIFFFSGQLPAAGRIREGVLGAPSLSQPSTA
jgi:hypothetical protein